MGKHTLSPEEMMENLNKKSIQLHSSVKSDQPSFRDLATKPKKAKKYKEEKADKPKDKKKHKKEDDNPFFLAYNPYEAGHRKMPASPFDKSEDEEAPEDANINDMTEVPGDVSDMVLTMEQMGIMDFVNQTLGDESDDEEDKEELFDIDDDIRDIWVLTMPDLKRIVIDDGIAPKSFYFENSLIDRAFSTKALVDKDLKMILLNMKYYLVSLCYPNAIFREAQTSNGAGFIGGSDGVVKDLSSLKADGNVIIFRHVDMDNEYIYSCYHTDMDSFKELDDLILDICGLQRDDQEAYLMMILVYFAIIKSCSKLENVFMISDPQQVEDFFMSTANEQDALLRIFDDDREDENVSIFDEDKLHVTMRKLFMEVFNDNGLPYDYEDELDEDEMMVQAKSENDDVDEEDEEEEVSKDNDIKVSFEDSEEPAPAETVQNERVGSFEKVKFIHPQTDLDAEEENIVKSVDDEMETISNMPDNMFGGDNDSDEEDEDEELDTSQLEQVYGIDKIQQQDSDDSLVVDVVRNNKKP